MKRAWFPVLPESQYGDLRLLCVPHAGAGASIYRNWIGLLPPSVLVCPVQLPGREDRYSEASKTSIVETAEELACAIAATIDGPYILFGYSMGALIVFETARYARRRGFCMPAGLVVAAHQAPQYPIGRKAIWNLPDSQFIAELRAMGGMPEEIFGYPELLEFVLPVLRSDFEACDLYRYSAEPPLDVPLAVIGGREDPHVSRELLEAWHEQTSQRCRIHLLPGGHFFLKESRESLMSTLAQSITELRVDTQLMPDKVSDFPDR